MILKLILAIVAGWFLWKIFTTFMGYLDYLHYKKQGVVFLSKGYTLFEDLKRVLEITKKYPTAFSWRRLFEETLKTDKLPPAIGVLFMGQVNLTITSAEMLEDIYINKNAQTSKWFMSRWQFWKIMPSSIVFQPSEDPTYPEKRKALSSAFFKNKLLGMTQIIKEITLKEIKEIQEKGKSEVSLAHLTLSLQSRIIINISVGMGYSKTMLDYEQADGKTVNIDLADYLDRLITDTITRLFTPHNLLFPLFVWAIYSPTDYRYNRNVQRYRDLIQRMINERRSGQTKSYSQDDLLSILINTDFFQGNDSLIIDEVFTFFLAGMKTI